MSKFHLSQYKYTDLVPMTPATQSVTLASGSQIQFEIPMNTPKAKNLNRTKLCFSSTIGAALTGGNWLFTQTVPFFNRIELTSRTGIRLIDIAEAHRSNDMLTPLVMSLEYFLAQSNYYDGYGVAQGIQCHRLNTPVVATTGQVVRPTGTSKTVFQAEPIYVVNGGAIAAGPVINWSIPLRNLAPCSFFSDDEDYIMNDILTLTLTMNDRTLCGFWSTNTGANLIAAGTITGPSVFGKTAAGVANELQAIALTGIKLWVANQENQEMNKITMENYNKGFTKLIDWQLVEKRNIAASITPVFVKRFTRANGQRLKRIVHSLYNNAGSSVNTYNRDNSALDRVTSYYLNLNGVRTTDRNINVAFVGSVGMEDFQINKHMLDKKIAGQVDYYYYNYCILQDFADGVDSNELAIGVEVPSELEYSLNLTTANAAYDHVNVAVFQRELKLGPNMVELI